MPIETSTKIAVQEFHLWIRRFYHIAMHSSKGPRAKIICRTHIMSLPTLGAPLIRNIKIIFDTRCVRILKNLICLKGPSKEYQREVHVCVTSYLYFPFLGVAELCVETLSA